MSNEILPISKNEFKKLDMAMKLLRKKYECSTSILNFDNNFILVEVGFGIPTNSVKENVKINRQTMEVIEKIQAE